MRNKKRVHPAVLLDYSGVCYENQQNVHLFKVSLSIMLSLRSHCLPISRHDMIRKLHLLGEKHRCISNSNTESSSHKNSLSVFSTLLELKIPGF